MPFSRYQIRNEFSLADPELYKAADKDDPEALLEGVAMAGLVGVLRQLGDLAEFAAEIFHGLHEEVMATAARGHGLLTRVQQVESDLPLIERAFLSQTGHSAFFSSSGINWHPNLQTEQNLITKGDLPRFVMDSYEECRGPPRLFLLDKFDVAGAGACLKRYTDPSIYKVEVSSFEMMSAEAQRDKKIRKIKKKGSRVKNGDTPESLQSSHVKLHQLLLEERVQTGASEPARRVKIKKRDIKFPFDTETGKGYMETLLSSPPEDKLVHEVKMVNSTLPEEPELETLEDKMVNSTLDVIEEKHISVVEENKEDGVEDAYQSDDVASETDNYMDALATMESEVETDVEFRAANSDPSIKQETLSDLNLEKIQESQVLDSQFASDDESSPMKGKITNFSYSDSDSASTSANNTSPRVNSPHAFASKEIPFRPRALPAQATDNEDLFMDQETSFKESNSKESDLSDVNIPTKKGEIEMDPEDVIASVTSEDDNFNSTLVNSHVEEQSFGQKRDQLDICEDDVVKTESGLAEARVSYSNEDETELKDRERESVDCQSANVAVCDNDSKERDTDNNISENEKELDERIPESFCSETKDSITVTDDTVEKESAEESVERESVEESITSREIDSIPSEYYDHSHIQVIDSIHTNETENDTDKQSSELVESDEKKESSEESIESGEIKESSEDQPNIQFIDSNHENWVENDANNPAKESVESSGKKESSEEPVSSPESDSIPSANHDPPNVQFLDGIDNNGNESDDDQLEKESSEEPVIFLESDSVPSVYHDHSNIQSLDSIHNNNENDIVNDNPSTEPVESGEKKESSEESVIVPESDSSEKTDQNGFQDVSPNVDLQGCGPVLAESAEAQESNSLSVDQNGEINKLEVKPPTVDLLLPELAPINMEEMPPLPPLPPMQWRMGRSQNPSMMSIPGGGHADISHFSPAFPQIQTQNEISRNEKFVEEVVPQPPIIKEESPKDSIMEESKKDPISEPEIIRLPSTSSLPSGDDEMPNGIRPMKVQRPRTPLIDAVAAHDKNKLRKVSERAVPLFPKEEEKDTFLEQIRAKSFNLKPAAPTRPIIQGPTTNLRVAAILEKANAIRQAFAGSDDDEDGSDSWSE